MSHCGFCEFLSRVKFLKLVQVQTFFRHGARTPLHHVRSPAVHDVGRIRLIIIFRDVSQAFWTPALTEDLEHTVYPFKLVEECSKSIIDFSTISSLPIPLKLPGGLYTGELIKHGQQEAFDLGRRLKCVYIDGNPFLSPNLNEEELYCRSTLIARTVKSLECVVAGLFSPRDASKVDALTIYVLPLDREYLFPNPAVCSIVDQLAKDGMAECLESRRHSELKRKLKKILG
ncbi:lysophosphatidic acid phosphatase type 6, partial [Paragonimus westermani]